MPLALRPFRFARRLTETEIREREEAREWAKRHAGCEDEPCEDCGGTTCRWCGETTRGEEFCSSACKGKSDAEADDAGRSLVLDTVGTLFAIGLALMLGGCGTEAPCQDPGLYCDANTLCVNGQAVECAEATGGTCETRDIVLPHGTMVTAPNCLPPRPPPPGVSP